MNPTSINTDFELVLRHSGYRLQVPAELSILEAIEEIGIQWPNSCREGVCGTCEATVANGKPDHRDKVLTQAERSAGTTMMICVSRSLEPVLELDL